MMFNLYLLLLLLRYQWGSQETNMIQYVLAMMPASVCNQFMSTV